MLKIKTNNSHSEHDLFIRLFSRPAAAAGRRELSFIMKIRLGMAGRKRWLGRRPHVRGTAMNPIDHPMGGGEGRSKGHTPRSPTGVLAKGGKTRRRRKPSNATIIRRRVSVRYG